MANTVPSTNMGMPVPVVGQDTGPQWATDLNSCLSIVDAHTHTPGSGVQITPAAININSDLGFNSNNLTAARSLRLMPQASVISGASDLGCLYEVGVDLYYNDGSGNQVRITQSGGVAGSPGSISNLTSPASAAYSAASSTFIFQSAANTSAYIDGASILLRNLTANSKALTLSPPAAMGANYGITLPTLPGSGSKFVSMDSTGAMAASLAVDGSTLEVSSNVVQVKALGITAAQIANNTITASQIANNTITATQIANGTITGTQIASGVSLAGSVSLGGSLSQCNGLYLATSNVSSSGGYVIVQGYISAVGAKVRGDGFTCSKVAGVNGHYSVTFTFSFADLPSVSILSVYDSGQAGPVIG